MARIGFVGLGSLGSEIAKRLLDAGHDIIGYNRTKSRADWLIESGMHWAASPRAAAQAGDMLFSIVRDSDALRDVTQGPDGIIAGLKPGQIYADMSTVSPLVSQAIAEEVQKAGGKMLEIPLSGSKITLKAGKMSMMVGGDEAALEAIRPILLDIGPTISHIGPNGRACAIKVAINLTMPIQIIAFAEGVLLAEKYGVDRALAIDVMLKSVAASPAIIYRLPWVLQEPEEHLFNIYMMQKDLDLALELGAQLGVPMYSTELSSQIIALAHEMGLSDRDFYALFEVLAKQAGLDH
jgi:3-hydroxyisobutyrate dehydrogenase-like beta-hydroxyacid dehydrogenase